MAATADMPLPTEDEQDLADDGDEETSFRLPDGSILEEYDLPEGGGRPRSDSELQKPGSTESLLSLYGSPVLPDEAAALCPPGGGGLVWHAQLLTSASESADVGADGQVRARRPLLPVQASDFFASLVRTADGRWIFSGILNGWPALQTLELRSITTVRKHKIKPGSFVKRLWDAERTPDAAPIDSVTPNLKSVRATLRSPPWSGKGYAAGNPGFVWWFFAQEPTPKMVHGDAILPCVSPPAGSPAIAVRAHLFSHRYGRPKKETRKDKLTYHSAILLEWDHGRFTTVIELATLNGIGGRRGKSNWFDDKLEDRPALYRSMPEAMCAPWKGEFAEIRCSDVAASNLQQFKEYIAKYTLNYMGRDRRYTEKVRNCQAFAADMFSFVAGKKGIDVFLPLLRPLYTPRTHLFLYDPEMYNNPEPEEPDHYTPPEGAPMADDDLDLEMD